MSFNLKTGGYIENEKSKVVAVLPEDITDNERDILWHSKEMHEAVLSFVEDTDNGKFKPRAAYNRFKEVLNKIKHP